MSARAPVSGRAAQHFESDVVLVTRSLAGERECYSTLVRRYQDDLYRYACALGIDHDTGQDLVQDAFVRAYVRLAECRDAERFRFWVLRILRNACLDELKSARHRGVPLEAIAQRGEEAPRHELRRALADALAALPELLREAFLLKHHEGYSYEEMAELAGASVSAMKMRVQRARDALRETLLEAAPAAM